MPKFIQKNLILVLLGMDFILQMKLDLKQEAKINCVKLMLVKFFSVV